MAHAESENRMAWRAALACMASLAVAMGLGRFAFTPLLPLMLAEGRLDLAGGGALASLNYLGYFVGALSCAALRVKPATMVRIGLAGTVLLLAAMGAWQGFGGWAAIRLAAGIVSAWTFVFASGWGLRRLAETHAARLAGVIYTGPGVGIAAAGIVVGLSAQGGSRLAWLACALLALACVAAAWRSFTAHETAPGTAAVSAASAPVPFAASDAAWLTGLYGLAGFGYIITATFLPVIARQSLPGSPWPDLFWPLFGLSIIPGALIGARAPSQWDNRVLLAIAYALQAMGILASIVWPTLAGLAVGSLLLGLPFTAITLFAVREARRLRGNDAAGLIAYATASYGVGQIVGPIFAGPLAQRTGSFTVALAVAGGALALGSLLFLAVWWHAVRRRPCAAG